MQLSTDGRHGILAATLAAVLGSVPSPAAVLEVGTGGAYASIQDAIDAATGTPQDDEVRIRAGVYTERPSVGGSDLGGMLEITGGWNATFDARDPDPASTVIDAQSMGRAMEFTFVSSGSLVLRGLTLQNGRTTDAVSPHGAGLVLHVSDIEVRVERCRVVSSQATSSNATQGINGGGLLVQASGTAVITFTDLELSGNQAMLNGASGVPAGGGGAFSLHDNVELSIRRAQVSGNSLAGGSFQRGAGLFFFTTDTPYILIEDSTIDGNFGDQSTNGSGIELAPDGDAVMVARRLEVTDNRFDNSDTSQQVYVRLVSSGSPTVLLSDSVIARGGTGLAMDGTLGTFHASHLTLTGHVNRGADFFVSAPGVATLANTIAWNNTGADAILSGATGESNLLGVNPLFVGPNDYHLSPLSDAVDGGTSTPSGGLPSLDLDHAPRWDGAAPDQGAYELGGIFGDGFESGDISAWL